MAGKCTSTEYCMHKQAHIITGGCENANCGYYGKKLKCVIVPIITPKPPKTIKEAIKQAVMMIKDE